MDSNLKQMKSLTGGRQSRECETCLYLASDEAMLEKEKCLRFARFVDHLLNENSRDCEYWQPAHSLTASITGYSGGEKNNTDKIELQWSNR
jgi:hypothetical protein